MCPSVTWCKPRRDLPTGVNHDMRSAARAEFRYGRSIGISDALFLTVRTGIGAAAESMARSQWSRKQLRGMFSGTDQIELLPRTDRGAIGDQ